MQTDKGFCLLRISDSYPGLSDHLDEVQTVHRNGVRRIERGNELGPWRH